MNKNNKASLEQNNLNCGFQIDDFQNLEIYSMSDRPTDFGALIYENQQLILFDESGGRTFDSTVNEAIWLALLKTAKDGLCTPRVHEIREIVKAHPSISSLEEIPREVLAGSRACPIYLLSKEQRLVSVNIIGYSEMNTIDAAVVISPAEIRIEEPGFADEMVPAPGVSGMLHLNVPKGLDLRDLEVKHNGFRIGHVAFRIRPSVILALRKNRMATLIGESLAAEKID